MTLEAQLSEHYSLTDTVCEDLHTPTNDVIAVTTAQDKFALKLYHAKSRPAEVQWELDLVAHLLQNGAPVVKPIPGHHGYLETFVVDGQERVTALFEWAPGEKPKPERDTYVLLGKAAAQIHQAADTFTSSLPREAYDATKLIDTQLNLMKAHLIEAERWEEMVALGERMNRVIANPALDYGICHMDLTLDNVHRDGDSLTVFDFDSSGESWRALEPHGILRSSAEYFQAWLEGYRTIRPFNELDERAVAAFGIIGNLRVVAWDLGVALSSRGKPLLTSSDLTGVVDAWLEWERKYIATDTD